MKLLERSDILSLDDYEAQRAELRRAVKAVKDVRRATIGEHLTFVFENTRTARHQVHEDLRTNGLTSDEDVTRLIDAQNERLGGEGEIACTLLIHVEDLEEREVKLREWVDLTQHVFLVIEGGRHVPGVFDPRQVSEGRMSSVQYLKFACGDRGPVAVVCTRPGMEARVPFPREVQLALAEDLGVDPPAED